MGGMARMMTPDYHHVINIDVWGLDSDLSGTGWGATTELNDLTQPAYPDGLQCIHTHGARSWATSSGSKDGCFSPGLPIRATASSRKPTSRIRWIGDDLFVFVLEGTGVVMRL
jgi:hypothetical protein